MCLHYAISSWFSTALTIVQHKNHKLLKLPPPAKGPKPLETITLTEELTKSVKPINTTFEDSVSESEKLDFTAEDMSGISPKTFREHDQKSEEEFLEELTGKHLDAIQKGPTKFDTPYTPIFKLGQYKEEKESSDTEVMLEDNCPPPPAPPGFLKNAVG